MTADQQAKKRYVLRLYTVNGGTEVKTLAAALVNALKAHCPGDGSIELVDVLDEPEKAVTDNIFATPTIVKELPEPMRRVIGNITDPTKVLVLLGLIAADEAEVESDE